MKRFCEIASMTRGTASSRRVLSGLAILLGASGLLLLSGCGATPGFNLGAGSTTESQGVALQGKMFGGQAPVSGATIELLAPNTGGYGTAPTVLDSTTTDGGGNFTLTGNYTCPAAPADQVLLIGIGGNSGGGTNPNLVQIAALGTCSSLTSSSFVLMNEVTTVVSAYSLAQFLTYTSTIDTPPASSVTAGTVPNFGIPTSGGSCNAAGKWTSTGAKTCNYIGLKNAMLTAQSMANIVTNGFVANVSGNVPANSKVASYTTITPGNDSYVPSARINTLADILSSCVNSTGGVAGGAAGACNTLFTVTTPTGAAAPTDTLQAILDLAWNPYLSGVSPSAPASGNAAAFYALAAANPPFLTPATLTAAPNDWTLALGYTSGGLTNAKYGPSGTVSSAFAGGLAIDQQGNIWATSTADQNTNNGGIVGLTNQGAPISPNTTSSAWGAFQTDANFPFYDPAIDTSGKIFFANFADGSFAALNQSGTSALGPIAPPFTHDIDGSQVAGIAVDHSDNIWLLGTPTSGSGAAVGEFNSSGVEQSPYYSETSTVTAGFSGIALDASSHVWFSTEQGDYELSTSGSLVHNFAEPSLGELAVDSSGNVWGCGSGNVFEDPSSGPPASEPNSTGGCYASNAYGPVAIDGLGNLWMPVLGTAETSSQGHLDEVATTGANAGKTISPATYGYQGAGIPGSYGASNGEGAEYVIENGIIGDNSVVGTAVDGSGNVWVLNGQAGVNTSTQQIVEFVGLGAPAVTPKALAAEYGTFSSLP